jgi:carbon monoxide dehydrogenase subunit G
MPTDLRVAATIAVNAPPERVWRAVVDWPRQHEWIWGTRVWGGQGVGAEVTGWTGIGPVGFTDTMVITEWDPPRRCAVRHTGRIVRGTGVFEVAARGARGSSSEFRWAEYLQLPIRPAVGTLVAGVIGPIARWGLQSSLRRFTRLVPPS